MKHERSPTLIAILKNRGTASAIAKGLGVTRAAISAWREIPITRLKEVSKITGIPRNQLRPDIFEELYGE